MYVKTDYIYYIAVLFLAVLSYFWFDLAVTGIFIPLKDTAFYNFFRVVTKLGLAEYQIVPGVLLYLIFRKRNPFWSKVGLALALSAALAGLSADVIKFLAGRYRPSMYISDHLYGFSFFKYNYGQVSFPSGHSATIFGAMGVLSLIFKRFRFVFLAIGVMVAFSRVATLQHYVSDVLAGSALGMASSIFVVNRIKFPAGSR